MAVVPVSLNKEAMTGMIALAKHSAACTPPTLPHLFVLDVGDTDHISNSSDQAVNISIQKTGV